MSQEEVAERLAVLYGFTLDELVEFDIDVREIQEVIDRTSEEVSEKIDWTKAWSRKYPILASYQSEVEINDYAAELAGVTSGGVPPALDLALQEQRNGIQWY